MKRLAIILLGFLAFGCTAREQGVKKEESIGFAEMKADRTIILQLRAEGPEDYVGEGYFKYPPTHPEYQKILDHVGRLAPGQSVAVRPWPNDKTKSNQSPQRNAGDGPASSNEAPPLHRTAPSGETARTQPPRG